MAFCLTASLLLMCLLTTPDSCLAQGAASDNFKPFKLRTLDGKGKTLADFSNKVILVSFFFPTCPYCNESFPEIQSLYDKYKDRGLSAVWINILPAQDNKIRAWQRARHFTVPVLVVGNPTAVAMDYQIEGTPTHYLLDQDGKVLLHLKGYSTREAQEIEGAIERALSPAPATERATAPTGHDEKLFSALPDRPYLKRSVPEPTMTVVERTAEPPTLVVEGTLQQFDCLGKSARLRILAAGKPMAFSIPDPDVIAIIGRNASTVNFDCGPQKPVAVVLRYEPMEDKELGTAGKIRSIEFK